MNTFSSWSQPETITSRLAAVLAVLVLASLPAVAKASPDIHLDLFGATEVTQLSEHQMSETRGEFFQNSYSWIVAPPYPYPIPIVPAPVVPCCYGSSDLGFSSSPGLNFEGGNGGGNGSGNTWWGGNSGSFGSFSSGGSFSFGSFGGSGFGVSSGSGGGGLDETEAEVVNVADE